MSVLCRLLQDAGLRFHNGIPFFGIFLFVIVRSRFPQIPNGNRHILLLPGLCFLVALLLLLLTAAGIAHRLLKQTAVGTDLDKERIAISLILIAPRHLVFRPSAPCYQIPRFYTNLFQHHLMVYGNVMRIMPRFFQRNTYRIYFSGNLIDQAIIFQAIIIRKRDLIRNLFQHRHFQIIPWERNLNLRCMILFNRNLIFDLQLIFIAVRIQQTQIIFIIFA